MCIMITNDETSMGYMDLTGRFICFSSSGHEYLLVGYNYGANAILVEPPKNDIKILLQTDGIISINNSQQQDCNPRHVC